MARDARFCIVFALGNNKQQLIIYFIESNGIYNADIKSGIILNKNRPTAFYICCGAMNYAFKKIIISLRLLFQFRLEF